MVSESHSTLNAASSSAQGVGSQQPGTMIQRTMRGALTWTPSNDEARFMDGVHSYLLKADGLSSQGWHDAGESRPPSIIGPTPTPPVVPYPTPHPENFRPCPVIPCP